MPPSYSAPYVALQSISPQNLSLTQTHVLWPGLQSAVQGASSAGQPACLQRPTNTCIHKASRHTSAIPSTACCCQLQAQNTPAVRIILDPRLDVSLLTAGQQHASQSLCHPSTPLLANRLQPACAQAPPVKQSPNLCYNSCPTGMLGRRGIQVCNCYLQLSCAWCACLSTRHLPGDAPQWVTRDRKKPPTGHSARAAPGQRPSLATVNSGASTLAAALLNGSTSTVPKTVHHSSDIAELADPTDIPEGSCAHRPAHVYWRKLSTAQQHPSRTEVEWSATLTRMPVSSCVANHPIGTVAAHKVLAGRVAYTNLCACKAHESASTQDNASHQSNSLFLKVPRRPAQSKESPKADETSTEGGYPTATYSTHNTIAPPGGPMPARCCYLCSAQGSTGTPGRNLVSKQAYAALSMHSTQQNKAFSTAGPFSPAKNSLRNQQLRFSCLGTQDIRRLVSYSRHAWTAKRIASYR